MDFNGFHELPEEIIDHVCANLPKQDIHNLRLTCKHLAAKSYHQFLVCHFRAAQFIFTEESLRTLISFAKDPKIGPAIKELQLCLVTFPPQKKHGIHENPLTEQEKKEASDIKLVAKTEFGPKRVSETVDSVLEERLTAYSTQLKRNRRRLYSRYEHDQHTMRTKSTDVEMLSEALRLLPALDSITLMDRLDRNDPPWGARKIVNDTSLWPVAASVAAIQDDAELRHYWFWSAVEHGNKIERRLKAFSAHSIGVVLGAIYRSRIKLKGSLSFRSAPYSLLFPMTPTSRNKTPLSTPAKTFAESQIEELKPAMSKLTAFSVSLYEYLRGLDRWGLGDSAGVGEGVPLGWILKLLPFMSALQRLHIVGEGFRGLTEEKDLWKSFADDKVCLPKLCQLEIRSTQFRVADLCQVFANHRDTLQDVSIQDSIPSGGNYLHLLQALTELPAMRVVDLLNGAPSAHVWVQPPRASVLPGFGTCHFHAEGQSPSKFQWELRSQIQPHLTAIGLTLEQVAQSLS